MCTCGTETKHWDFGQFCDAKYKSVEEDGVTRSLECKDVEAIPPVVLNNINGIKYCG